MVSQDGPDEKTPLLRTATRVYETSDRLLDDSDIAVFVPATPQETKRKRRKGKRRQRILGIVFIVVLIWALARRLIPFTSSWVCLSASRFFLISTTKCALPFWYDVEPSNDASSYHNISNTIPKYVYEYAPLVHLFSDEKFWPCNMSSHLLNTTPALNYTLLDSEQGANLSLSNLDQLNSYNHGRHVFLTSNDNVEARPQWIVGAQNKPSAFTFHTVPIPSSDPSLSHPHGLRKPKIRTITTGGRSTAPAYLILVPKTKLIVDAFYFFFYSYNHGNEVLRLRFGNHVGDWEHTMIRFYNGTPKAVFFSEHDFGSAYAYSAVEKVGKRPVLYSATGTHAMYATPGLQPYVLPWGLLHDRTDKGPVWDPAENLLEYTYDHHADRLTPAANNPNASTNWFFFNGHWGDKQYPLDDSRQYSFLGELHYVTGPLGPRFKNLGRRKVCQGPHRERCELKHWLGGGLRFGRGRRRGRDDEEDGEGTEGEGWRSVGKGVLPPGLEELDAKVNG